MKIVDFERNGFAVAENILDAEMVSHLRNELSELPSSKSSGERRGAVYGVRNLLDLSPAVREFADSKTVGRLGEKYLGETAKVVRAIYFDKTPQANWKVPWHQDLTIAVREKRETAGFSPWTRKAGIWHVQPPIKYLEKMLTLRFHLDDADETNGALKVLANSHRSGRLTAEKIKTSRQANDLTVCRVKTGDCLIMRPLILHSSSPGSSPRHRRVVHLELSAEKLPNGLEWYGS